MYYKIAHGAIKQRQNTFQTMDSQLYTQIFRTLQKIIILLAAVLALTGCISDGITTSPSDAPTFSSDTLDLGTLWADEASPTAITTLKNHADKSVILEKVSVTDCKGGTLSINVDGRSGTEFSGVEIRGGDSIYILAEATPTGAFSANIEVIANGVTLTLPVKASTLIPTVWRDHTITADIELPEDAVVRVFGNLTIAAGVKLTANPGATIYFHDAASMSVDGSIDFRGEPDREVTLRGDRLSDVIKGVPFDVMSSQWHGVTIGEMSADNTLSHISIQNTSDGINMLSGSALNLDNCRVTNSAATLISANSSTLTATGTEFTNAAGSLISLTDSKATIDRCTLSNHYLFALPTGAALSIDENSSAKVTESIIHGDGSEAEIADEALPNVRFEKCLFGTTGTDDQQFTSCLWGKDPMFMLDLENYLMDFRLDPASPARDQATATRTDRYGIAGRALGAYN